MLKSIAQLYVAAVVGMIGSALAALTLAGVLVTGIALTAQPADAATLCGFMRKCNTFPRRPKQ